MSRDAVDGLLLGILAGAPLSVQALAARTFQDAPEARRRVFSLAADGLLEGAGRGEAGARLWRLTDKGRALTTQALTPPPVTVPTSPPPLRPPSTMKATPIRRRAKVTKLRPWSAQRARFCGWFVDAGWPVDLVAELFDADPADVATVRPAMRGAA